MFLTRVRRRFYVALSLLILFVAAAAAAPARIVSLSPVGTEILFDLGLEDRIAGVTEFCDYPPEAKQKPKAGGFTEVNLESLVAMSADLLVLQDLHRQELAPKLEALGIPYYILSQESTEDICRGILELGELCGVQDRAEARVAEIRSRLDAVTSRLKDLPRPRVLLSVSRELTLDYLETLYVAGPSGNFYDELIQMAGGVNAVEEGPSYVKISQEGVLKIDPEVILDLVGDQSYYHAPDAADPDRVFSSEHLMAPWLRLSDVRAVREGRVHILRGTFLLRPGPRIPQIVEAFARCTHPGALSDDQAPAAR